MNEALAVELVRRVVALEAALERLQAGESGALYRGTQAGDFSTTELPQEGDWGYQTTDNEVQVNCNGTVRAITTAAL